MRPGAIPRRNLGILIVRTISNKWILRSSQPGWAPQYVSFHQTKKAAMAARSKRLRALRADPPRYWDVAANRWIDRIPTLDVVAY